MGKNKEMSRRSRSKGPKIQNIEEARNSKIRDLSEVRRYIVV